MIAFSPKERNDSPTAAARKNHGRLSIFLVVCRAYSPSSREEFVSLVADDVSGLSSDAGITALQAHILFVGSNFRLRQTSIKHMKTKRQTKTKHMTTSALPPAGLPVGSIATYGGNLSVPANLQALQKLGWLLCDGASYAKSAYPDLFAAIGIANGGGSGNFNVPNLQSRFLRGTDRSGKGTDPDAASRIAAAPGGAQGINVGSLEKTATALPNTPWQTVAAGNHSHTCLHLSSTMHEVWSGSTYTMARWNADAPVDSAGSHFHTLGGFDPATIPVNMALYFIIKAQAIQNDPSLGTTPTGAILAFGGPPPQLPAQWLPCDGRPYGVTLYPNLLDAILYNYGGDGQTVLNVPDFRGYFLRGTCQGVATDPDRLSRRASAPGGNTGDQPGSAEGDATKTPAGLAVASAGDHSHNIAKVPQDDHHAAYGASGPAAYNTMEWTGDATTSTTDGSHTHVSITGGDKETRPENIYADFIIADDEIPNSSPPIGTIVSYGGDTTAPNISGELYADGWLPCNGALCTISQFQALYNVIGTTFGQANLKFGLPDLRGLFITGAGKLALGTVQAKSTAGSPVTPIVTSTDGAHSHTMHNIPTDTHVIDVVMGWDLAENNPNKSPTSTDGKHTHGLTGGDSESRPENVYVNYIIRFK